MTQEETEGSTHLQEETDPKTGDDHHVHDVEKHLIKCVCAYSVGVPRKGHHQSTTR